MGATLSDIAVAAKTSVAAVSVTLNGAKSATLKVSAETRQRILKAAEELCYRRNPYGQTLATGRSTILGLMLPGSGLVQHDPFFSLITTGITAYAAENGYNVMLYSAAAEEDAKLAAPQIDRLVAGLIFVSPPSNTPLFEVCEKQGIDYVAILGDPHRAALSVNSDDEAGGMIATNHLLSLGHRRIAHLLGTLSVITTRPRFTGYRKALISAGIDPDPSLVMEGKFGRATSYKSTLALLHLPSSKRPTAIFAANDLSAHGAIDAIQDAGLRVPKDIAVIGYDDTWYATVPRPSLTSVSMGVGSLGRAAAQLLVARLKGASPTEPHCLLPVALTVRESCGASMHHKDNQ